MWDLYQDINNNYVYHATPKSEIWWKFAEFSFKIHSLLHAKVLKLITISVNYACSVNSWTVINCCLLSNSLMC